MDLRFIPPSLQLLWAEEVLYLHSLWYQGPPPNPNPNPNLNNKKRKNSEIEWPVNPVPDPSTDYSSWPDPTPRPNSNPNPKPIAICPQRAALKFCRKFLSSDDSSEEEDEEESKSFEFFLGIFERDGELSGYYKKNHEKGEFMCLVCGGIWVKVGKWYMDCISLVQDSTVISKTKRRGAHRGFGRAVCRVLGWNIDRLPSIVLDIGQPSEKPSDKVDELKHDVMQEVSNQDFANCIKLKEIEMLNKVKDGNGELLIDSGEHPEIKKKDKEEHQISSPSDTPAEVTAQVQQNVLKACQDFLSKSNDDRESEAFEFFSTLFDMDCDLRHYYEKNYSKGEFCCLVCGAFGMKTGKKFGHCIGLVQHSKSVSNATTKWAHHAFGRAICQVFGWNINRLPSIILDVGQPSRKPSDKVDESKHDVVEEVSNEDFADCIKLKETEMPNKVKDGNGELLIDSGEHPEIRKKDKEEHQISSPSDTPAEVTAQVQQNVLKAWQDFLSKSDDDRESEAFEFFSTLFDMDCDLRHYYEKNYSKGEFCCLVCGAFGMQTGMKFDHCIGLVHHSKSVFNATTKWAHHAFGRAVCQVFGWNINRLPSIILDIGQPSVKPSDKVDESKEVKEGNGEVVIDSGEHPAEVTAQVQQNVLKACHDFLSKSDSSSSNEEEMDKRESEAFEFFSTLFDINCDLRHYYEKNYSKGEFSCLVCGAFGMKKSGKKFGRCIGLVHHSKSASNARRKWAHHAFGRAACQVLSWDINGYPIVLKACHDFLSKSDSSSSNEEEMDKRESEAFEFFSTLFDINCDLRHYYEKNYSKGEFSCLVCGAFGMKKSGKKFGRCIGLVHHSKSASNARRKWAHHAFGRAACQVLSWDINGYPIVLKACHDFLSKSDSSSSNEEEMDKRESEAFEFFSTLFDINCDLRHYYEKNYSKGEFSCLVCGAFGMKKSGKKFGRCIGLVHHSKSASNARRKWAHHAFGRAACQVLSWDINGYPIVLKACHDFLSKSDSSSSNEEEMDKRESEAFEFFSTLFDINCDLRHYYEKNYSKGEFSCLVCGAFGMKKSGKKFGRCIGLVHHSKSASNARRKWAHHAFGRAACQVLSWDINGYPIVLKACHDFLSKSDSSSSNEEEMDKRESEAFEFFSTLFDINCDLRHYYEKNYSKGEFSCLVCGAFGMKKSGKKFGRCIGLVHHSKSASNARRKWAHHAFGRAACQVLSWDINGYPIVLKACHDFLSKSDSSSSNEEEMDKRESEAFEFFSTLFDINCDLRHYYEKNYSKGEFSCLVCGAFGMKKSGKKFGRCIGLVHHSKSASNARRKWAHHAFGRAACQVLSWDINGYPIVLKACHDFLSKSDSSSSNEEEMDKRESEAFEFFSTLFDINCDLRHYYEKNYSKGEFSCLVCGAFGMKKSGKKFGRCIGLVHHSKSASNARRKWAHHAFGRAACQVLSWDINGYPIVLKACHDFLSKSDSSSSNEEEMDKRESEAFEFFSTLFDINCDLRHYYEKNYSKGEFSCLVCGAFGMKKSGKKFGRCIGLVHHSKSASNARRKWAHHAFGRAACQVLSWDINGYPIVLKACHDFLSKSDSSSSNEEEMDKRESEAFEFFSTLFDINCDLRHYYEKNYSKGEFSCLVCGAFGMKKSGKKFGRCIGLVHHSKSASNARRKWAHHAFGRAACQVLGWDINGYPIVPKKNRLT